MNETDNLLGVKDVIYGYKITKWYDFYTQVFATLQ